MNGALNNLSMALELALGDPARGDTATEQTLRAGLAAIAQASRAAALIAHLVNGRGMPNDSNRAYANDVREILRELPGSSRLTLLPELDDPANDAAKAADLLVTELARMQARGTGRD
jgi:hypothetical protein